MTDREIFIVAMKYELALAEMNSGPERYKFVGKRNRIRNSNLYHAHWMLLQIPGMLKRKERDRALQWLGFAEGTLWSEGEWWCSGKEAREIFDLKEEDTVSKYRSLAHGKTAEQILSMYDEIK